MGFIHTFSKKIQEENIHKHIVHYFIESYLAWCLNSFQIDSDLGNPCSCRSLSINLV